MAQQTIDDRTLLASLFEIFRSHGYEGATIALLSEVTGLKKSSLYHRFPAGKEDMAKAVVDFVSSQLHQFVVEPLLNSRDAPETRFINMIATIKTIYSDGRKNCLLNVLCLGEAKDDIKRLLNKDYAAWLLALAGLGLEAGMNQTEAYKWSENFLIAVQGALVIQRLTGNASIFENCMGFQQEQFLQYCRRII